MRGVNRKGRNKRRGKFVALGNGLLTSEAWYSLGGGAVRYYIELRRRFNGQNNGELHLTIVEAMKVLGMGRHTVIRAHRELVKKGFIWCTVPGNWTGHMASTWALSDEPVGTQLPTNDYKNWPEKNSLTSAETAPLQCRNGTQG